MKGCIFDSRTKLTGHDRWEIKKFQRYLVSVNKYGLDKMIKHKYWRIYCGLEKA